MAVETAGRQNGKHQSGRLPLQLNFEDMASEMKLQSRWMLWRYEERDGKYSKVPYQINGKKASSASSLTWNTFENTIEAFLAGGYDGIGFALGNGYVGIDMDNCIEEVGLSPQAREILEFMDSYSEISPSGTGVHIICRGNFPETGRRKIGLEIYGRGHFLTVTGAVIEGSPKSIQERTDALITLYREYFDGPPSGQAMEVKNFSSDASSLDDIEIIARAAEARNGDLFRRLMAGNTSDYPSSSEADLALVDILAFWTRDGSQIDRIFRRSGLFRDKWDREDYRRRTINAALDKVKDHFGTPRDLTGGEEPLTEGGNATRLIRIHGTNMKFCHSYKKWYIWDGHRWKPDSDGEAIRLAEDVIRLLYREAAEAGDLTTRNKFAAFARACDRSTHLKNLLDIAKNRPGIAILADQLDQSEWLLNVSNTTLDLRTCKPVEPNRAFLMTKVAGAEYDPSANCPRWEQFLDEIFGGDQELISYIQRAAGYSLTGSMSEQVFFFCYGSGANGKSVFLDLLRSLLGDYAQQTDFGTFLVQRNERVRNDLAALVGARVITASEAEEGVKLSMQVIKHWTGGDPITTRFLYGEFFSFKPMGKIWLAANTKPIISERNHAAWRRIHLIPFQVTISQDKQDRELGDKLLKELPGVLNWALAGLREYLRLGLKPPMAVQAATEAYRRDSDSLQAFIGECCVVKVGLSIQNKKLFGAYEAFCRSRGYEPLSNRKFIEELRAAQAVREENVSWAGITWHGIDLVPSGDAHDHQFTKNDSSRLDGLDSTGEAGRSHKTFSCAPHVGELVQYNQVNQENESHDAVNAFLDSPGTSSVGLDAMSSQDRPCANCGVALKDDSEGPCGQDCIYKTHVSSDKLE